MFRTWQRLRHNGVLGMNRRNADFILRYNQRSLYPLVDDKLKTKHLACQAGIATPELYGVIEIEHDIAQLSQIVANHHDFVIKPAHGSGGSGILVITGIINGRYQRNNGHLMSEDDLQHHISNILSGLFSLGGQPDVALIEYRVHFDPLFEQVSYRGVPDIRTIVFRGVPVAAMVRLPTHSSDGKANLHQGAVGAGIDMQSGTTTTAVWHSRPVTHHPDSGAEIRGLQIPHWDTLLALAARCHDLVGLGYLGVDVVLDRDLGPLILELNARPGLAIQIANNGGLQQRLQQIDRMTDIPTLPMARARLGQSLAGSVSP